MADHRGPSAPPLLQYRPATAPAVPILANLPHSGLAIPEEIRRGLTPEHQRFLPHHDWHLDHLYRGLPELGIAVLQARYSRYVADLNRSPRPPLFGSFWRCVVPARTAFKAPLYRLAPTEADIAARVATYHAPYHRRLRRELLDLVDRFGQVILLDLHSFMGPLTDDVCLGNANGRTTSEALLHRTAEAFGGVGCSVVCNQVFTGGYITRHYGQLPGVQALQIELRYPVYLQADQLDRDAVPDWDVPALHAAQPRMQRAFAGIVAAVEALAASSVGP